MSNRLPRLFGVFSDSFPEIAGGLGSFDFRLFQEGNKNLVFGCAAGVGIIDSTLASIIEENGKLRLGRENHGEYSPGVPAVIRTSS